MIRKFAFAALAVFMSSATSFAADYGDLAGSYSGKLAKGGAIRITIPKSGTPSYSFSGDSVSVNSAFLSGKTIKMDVGSGHGSVTLTAAGKGKLSYRYYFNGNTAATTLTRD